MSLGERQQLCEQLEEIVAKIPRVKLGTYPTPLQEAPNLSDYLGVARVLIKREDLSGLALGGNKVRQLEVILAEAQAEGADCVIIAGQDQSNYCRQGAAGAKLIGMECHLVLSGQKEQAIEGNLLLDTLYGARVHYVQAPTGDFDALHRFAEALADKLRKAGKKPYIARSYSWIGAIGFLPGALELYRQLSAQGIDAARIVLLSAGATQAALVVAARFLGLNWDILGAVTSPHERNEDSQRRVAAICNQVSARLALDMTFTENDVRNTNEYAETGYGIITRKLVTAMSIAIETEGLLLDPIYTVKAFMALLGEAEKGAYSKDDTVVFIHTGGLPLVFRYGREILAHLRSEKGVNERWSSQ